MEAVVPKATVRNFLLRQPDPPLESLGPIKRVIYPVKTGDTLSRLLVRYGVPASERRLWLRSFNSSASIRSLRPGKEIVFYFSHPELSAGRSVQRLKALEMELDEDWTLAWERGDKGIVFSKRERPYDVELKTAGGQVEDSLFADGQRMGLNHALVSQLADIFTWDVDFERELRKGDSLKILYEQKIRKGSESRLSFRVLAAELISAGQKHFAFYFEKEKGKGNYYDVDGRSLARAFLRFPLEFTSIRSQFSHSRFHPILKVDRPHYGVDFAARRGTPVRAIGDGKILHASWRKGGFGRLVEIKHDSTYASRYAHLQGVARGIRPGASVKKGQVIGYVGSSGMSTGPHLHFELYKQDQYIDPLKFEYPPEDRLEPGVKKIFENLKQLFLVELAAAPHS